MRSIKIVSITLMILILLLSTMTARSSDLRQVPGTKVQIEIPASFDLAKDFPGIISKDGNSSIMISELPVPGDKFSNSFDRAQWASKGMKVLDKSNAVISGKRADLIKVNQSLNDIAFLKWIAIVGSENSTLLLTATFLVSTEASIGERLKNVILSAQWNPDLEIGLFQELGFEVKGSGELRPLKRIVNAVLIGIDGKFGIPDANLPVMIVGPLPTDSVNADNAFVASKQILEQMGAIRSVVIKRQSKVKLGGFKAYESEGTANHGTDGTPLVIYLALIPHRSSGVFILGKVGASKGPSYLSNFRVVANTITFK